MIRNKAQVKKKGSAKLVLTKDMHGISRQKISPKALSVIERLQNAHYKAYLVGGCIRDLLVGKTPKDFDVSTNATPEQVKFLRIRALSADVLKLCMLFLARK